MECVLFTLSVSPLPPDPFSALHPLLPQQADLYRLYHPGSHPMGFTWTWPMGRTRRTVRGLEERERAGMSLLLSSFVPWFSRGLHPLRTTALPQLSFLHGANTLWPSQCCHSSCCLTMTYCFIQLCLHLCKELLY